MEEMGFSSTAELLQRVEGVEVLRPPDATGLTVFKTAAALEEEEKEKEKVRTLNVCGQRDVGVPECLQYRLSLKKKVTLPTQPSVFKPVPLPAPSTSKFHPVYVTDVTTPSKLVVQLIGKETTQVLECLQEDMTSFYRSKEGKTFTIEDTYPGQVN